MFLNPLKISKHTFSGYFKSRGLIIHVCANNIFDPVMLCPPGEFICFERLFIRTGFNYVYHCERARSDLVNNDHPGALTINNWAVDVMESDHE